jgi:hypothetical protein
MVKITNKIHKFRRITDKSKSTCKLYDTTEQVKKKVNLSLCLIFFNLCDGTLGTEATTCLLYQPRMIGDGDCGKIGGMKICRGNRSTRRKPAPAPFCSPQIPHD